MQSQRRDNLITRGLVGLLIMLLGVIAFEWLQPRPRVFEPLKQTTPDDSEKLLDVPIGELSLHCTLLDAMHKLETATGVKIQVDWKNLGDWLKVPVDLEIRDARLGDIISYLFEHQFEPKNCPYTDFAAVDGKIVITAAMSLPKAAFTERVYDVRDLLTDEYWDVAPTTASAQSQINRADVLRSVVEEGMDVRNRFDSREGFSDVWQMGCATFESCCGWLVVSETSYGHRIVASELRRLRAGDNDSSASSPLHRQIGTIRFEHASMRDVLATLASKAKTTISLHADSGPRVSFAVSNATLQNAFDALSAAYPRMPQLPPLYCSDLGDGILRVSHYPEDRRVAEVVDAKEITHFLGEPFMRTEGGYGDARDESWKATLHAQRFALAARESMDYRMSAAVGTRIINTGNVDCTRFIHELSECVRQPPISLTSVGPIPGHKPPPRLPHFVLKNVPEHLAMQELCTAAGPAVKWRVPTPIPASDETVSLDMSNATPAEIAFEIVYRTTAYGDVTGSIEDGVLCFDAADSDEWDGYCSFDITPLLAAYDSWREKVGKPAQASEDEKETALIDLLGRMDCKMILHGRLITWYTRRHQREVLYLLRELLAGNDLPRNLP